MKELKAEKSRLIRQRDQQKAALRPLMEKRKRMHVITENVMAIFGKTSLLQEERKQLL